MDTEIVNAGEKPKTKKFIHRPIYKIHGESLLGLFVRQFSNPFELVGQDFPIHELQCQPPNKQ